MEELTHCPLCGQGPLTHHSRVGDHSISKEEFILQTCKACGFLLTDPRPGPAEIGRYYESDDYISHSNTDRGIQARLYQWARRRTLAKKHRQITAYHRSGALLDYGSGTGEFLAHMRTHGYAATGIEPSAKARALALTNHKITAHPDLAALPDGQFQVITLWHVLEHIHLLQETMQQLIGRLATGGLLIIAVPDRESWDAQHYGPHWAAYDVPRHLWHFRRKDVRRLLEQHGLVLERIAPMWFDAPYIAMHSERYRGSRPGAALLKGGLLGLWSNAMAAVTSRPTSSSLFFALKR